MAAVEADQVTVVLTADVADYEKKLAGASNVFESETKKIEESAAGAERATSISFAAIATGAAGVAVAIASALAAGVAAFLRFVDELDNTSQALGITTDRLQQLRYAADVSGVSSDALGKGMEHLRDMLREASLGAEKPVKYFQALGISIRDANGKVIDVSAALPILADRMNAIKDPTQRAATAQIGLGDAAEEMAPLLERGSMEINELANAATRLGLVLSSETIKQAKEAADKFEDVRRVLSYELMGVVTRNSDAIISLANAFAQLAANIGGAIQQLGILSNMSGFKSGDQASTSRLMATKSGRDAMLNEIDARIKQNQADRSTGRGPRRGIPGVFEYSGAASPQDLARLDGEFKALVRARNNVLRADARSDQKPPPAPAGEAPNVSGLLAPKGRSGPSADTLARRAESERRRQLRDDISFANEQDQIRMDILAAQTEILGDEDDKATLARARVSVQRTMDERSLSLDFERSEVEKDALRLLYREREAIELRAITEEKRMRELERDTDDRVGAIRRDAELFELQAQGAKTAKERQAIELKLLEYQYAEAEERLKLLAASKDTRVAAEARRDLEALPAKKEAATANVKRQNMGPLDAYLDSIPKTADEINQSLEAIAVGGLKDVEDGFASAATKALGLKGALGSVVEQMIKLVFQQQLLNNGGGILGGLGKLLGLASGVPGLSSYGSVTSSLAGYNPTFAPVNLGGARALGGPTSANTDYLVGENGPEILRMGSRAGFVIPNERVASKAGGGTTVVQPLHFDLRGAVITADLIQQMNSIAQRAATAGAFAGSSMAETNMMRRGRNRIPG